MKYALHQLFIVHGKMCLRCQATSKPTTPGWKETICCLEHLLKRDLLKQSKKRKAETTGETMDTMDQANNDGNQGKDQVATENDMLLVNEKMVADDLEIEVTPEADQMAEDPVQKPVGDLSEGLPKTKAKKSDAKPGVTKLKPTTKQQKQSKITDFAIPGTKSSVAARSEKPHDMTDLEFVFGVSVGKAMVTAALDDGTQIGIDP